MIGKTLSCWRLSSDRVATRRALSLEESVAVAKVDEDLVVVTAPDLSGVRARRPREDDDDERVESDGLEAPRGVSGREGAAEDPGEAGGGESEPRKEPKLSKEPSHFRWIGMSCGCERAVRPNPPGPYDPYAEREEPRELQTGLLDSNPSRLTERDEEGRVPMSRSAC